MEQVIMVITQPTSVTIPSESQSDGWTYIKLAESFSTTSPGSGENVPTLFFTPQANKTYLVKGIAILRAATAATDGARVGISWPSAGLVNNVATLGTVNNTSTTPSTRLIGGSTTQTTPNTAFPDNTNDWPGIIDALFTTNGDIAGDFQIVIANEVSGSTTTIQAGSYIAYKEI